MTPDLHIERIKAVELTETQRELWLHMRSLNPALYSPYFHPDYTQLIGELQNDAYIALISQGGETVGFLPFQQRRINGSARPVGAPMTDYHGIISSSETKLNVLGMMKTPLDALLCASRILRHHKAGAKAAIAPIVVI